MYADDPALVKTVPTGELQPNEVGIVDSKSPRRCIDLTCRVCALLMMSFIVRFVHQGIHNPSQFDLLSPHTPAIPPGRERRSQRQHLGPLERGEW
jgi:hypothetical protein